MPAVYLIGMWGKRRVRQNEAEAKLKVEREEKLARERSHQIRKRREDLGIVDPERATSRPMMEHAEVSHLQVDPMIEAEIDLEESISEATEERAPKRPVEGSIKRSMKQAALNTADVPAAERTKTENLAKSRAVQPASLPTKSCSTKKILASSMLMNEKDKNIQEISEARKLFDESSKCAKKRGSKRLLKKFMAQKILKKYAKRRNMREELKRRIMHMRQERRWDRGAKG